MAWDFIMPKKKYDRMTRGKSGKDAELEMLRKEKARLAKEREKYNKRHEMREEIASMKKEIRGKKYSRLYAVGRGLRKGAQAVRRKGERIAASKDVGMLFDAGRNRQRSNNFLSGFDYWHGQPKKKVMPKRRKRKRGRERIIIVRG